ncbi:VOC family protein [Haloglycomyces albus]|uniref:VOC family protein n=1 Tax=Haloglycomyces albus TaxID=526067 RepID=UPI00046CC52A|nr:VOC family protein [Haloglycomyces albus]
MKLTFNHTIVWAYDKQKTAEWWEQIFDVTAEPFGPFLQIKCENGADLDIADIDINGDMDSVVEQHYAFLIEDHAFDEILGRIRDRGIEIHAHPDGSGQGEYNTNDGGRGMYFSDPNGHNLEVITVPYGGWDQA